jgi:membrane-associated phospholipid phosphatase
VTPLDVIVWALVGAVCLVLLTLVVLFIVIAIRTIIARNEKTPASSSTTIIRKDPR